MTARLCACGCGKPAMLRSDYARPCHRRWNNAGRPASGPPPPMTAADRNALARASRDAAAREREAADGEPLPPDAVDLEWARRVHERIASEPDRRAAAMQPVATDLIGCVGRRDAKGIRELLAKVTDWPALVVVLADRAAWVDGERRVIWQQNNTRRSA